MSAAKEIMLGDALFHVELQAFYCRAARCRKETQFLFSDIDSNIVRLICLYILCYKGGPVLYTF